MTAKSTRPNRTGKAPAPMRRGRAKWVWAAVAVAAMGALFLSFQSSAGGQGKGGTTAATDFAVGRPGPGKFAPDVRLASTAGEFDLSKYKGKNVLLFFQEGLGCQPCWDQIRDLEKNQARLKAAGVDQLVSVTTGPLDLVSQKVKDDRLSTPVASDPDLAVSRAYEANKYGMMGDGSDGHSFVLVGPDGTITWRADYGGAPKYTMYVPVDRILADLAKATGKVKGT